MSYLPSNFDNDVQLLSTIKHVREHVPILSFTQNSDSEKNVKILNDIALLMTVKAKGDVTAVTWKLSQNCAEIFFCKNSPTDQSLDVYFNQILSIIQSPEPASIRKDKLLLLVLETCLEKVRSRIQKIQKALLLSKQPQPIIAFDSNTNTKILSSRRKSGITSQMGKS